jgi:hypothetical protein
VGGVSPGRIVGVDILAPLAKHILVRIGAATFIIIPFADFIGAGFGDKAGLV